MEQSGFLTRLAIQCFLISNPLKKQWNIYWVTVSSNLAQKYINKVFIIQWDQTLDYDYDTKWIWKTKKKDLITAIKFGNAFCFIDYLGVMNDGRIFGKAPNEIYMPEFELKKENN